MKITLRTKFIFLSSLLVTIIMITITYLFTIRELRVKRDAMESQMKRVAESIATMQLLDRQDWTVYQNYISQLIEFTDDIVFIAVYDDRNSLRAYALNNALIDSPGGNIPRWQEADIVKKLDRGAISKESREDLSTQRVNIQIGNRILGSVHVGFSLIKINDDLQRAIRLNIGLALFFFIIFIGAAVFVSGRLTGPLERLSSAMTRVAEGDLNQKIRIETRDEIGELADNFNEMVEGLRELRIIEELGNELSATFILKDLAQLVREKLGQIIGADATRLYIRTTEDSSTFEEVTVPDSDRSLFPSLTVSEEVIEYQKQHPGGFMIRSAPQSVQADLDYKSRDPNGLVLPLIVKDEVFGLLFFALPDEQSAFDAREQQFASMLAKQATLALENALLYEGKQEQERLRRELEIARDVQQKLLPSEMPQIEGFQITGFCHSAYEVGGDYFDFFRMSSGRLGIVIADVSGKGTSASFYMAELKGMMVQLTSGDIHPHELLIELNRHLYGNVDRHLFVTMIFGILDISSGTFTFARAGHNPLLKIDADATSGILVPSGIGLGLESGQLFRENIEEQIIRLKPGDTVVLYTDGITEVRNMKMEEYGEERLIQTLQSCRSETPEKQQKTILQDLKVFADGQMQYDDLTMVILKRDA